MGTRWSSVHVGRLLVGNKRYPTVGLQKARERGGTFRVGSRRAFGAFVRARRRGPFARNTK